MLPVVKSGTDVLEMSEIPPHTDGANEHDESGGPETDETVVASPAIQSTNMDAKQDTCKHENVQSVLVYWLVAFTIFVATCLSVGSSTVVYLMLVNADSQFDARDAQHTAPHHPYLDVSTRDQAVYETTPTSTTAPMSTCNNISATAFSVFSPSITTIENRDVLFFTDIKLNLGDNFNATNGTFVSSSRGIYVFFVTLGKRSAHKHDELNNTGNKREIADDVCCHLLKSGQRIVHIKVDPTDDGTDRGGTAITQTVILQLSVWDTVYLSPCDNKQQLEKWSSFSGYLLNSPGSHMPMNEAYYQIY